MEGNKDLEASGHIIGSEEFSNWMASKHINRTNL